MRLKLSDIETYDPWNDDFDNDGLKNQDELDIGTDPLANVDADLNGIPDDIDALWSQVDDTWKLQLVNDTDKAYYDPDGTINSLAAVLPTEDYDGDSVSNIAEFFKGTDPVDYFNGATSSVLKITQAQENIMKISLTSIFVDDPTKAHNFYTGALGFQSKEFNSEAQLAIVVSADDPTGTALLLEPRGDSFGLEYQSKVYASGLPIVVLGTPDLTSEVARLKAKGVHFRDDLKKPEWGIENLFEDTCGKSNHASRGTTCLLNRFT